MLDQKHTQMDRIAQTMRKLMSRLVSGLTNEIGFAFLFFAILSMITIVTTYSLKLYNRDLLKSVVAGAHNTLLEVLVLGVLLLAANKRLERRVRNRIFQEEINDIKHLNSPESVLRIQRIVRELAGISSAPIDLSGGRLEGIDLSSADLKRANLSGADLYHAVLKEVDLSHALLTKANLAGADLEAALLANADLREAVLTGADLRRADLTGIRYDQIDFQKANWDRIKFDADTIFPNPAVRDVLLGKEPDFSGR